ncbi:hypothetical protein BH09PLA1_BH09PLA1_33160 [soil metagenome]
MLRERRISLVLATAMAVSPLAALTGCESLPGDKKTQGAVIGGVGGAAAGALIGGKDNRLLGGLIGGAAGAGGGYLVGANWDKITGKKSDEAKQADQRAQERPARASDVENSRTADLNSDGFVTLDEVVAMADARLSDKEQIRRLESTQQYFELTPDQETYLRNHGVTKDVVVAMRRMNPEEPRRASDTTRDRANDRTDRISGDRS